MKNNLHFFSTLCVEKTFHCLKVSELANFIKFDCCVRFANYVQKSYLSKDLWKSMWVSVRIPSQWLHLGLIRTHKCLESFLSSGLVIFHVFLILIYISLRSAWSNLRKATKKKKGLSKCQIPRERGKLIMSSQHSIYSDPASLELPSQACLASNSHECRFLCLSSTIIFLSHLP